ncbi:GNAT family N-acetyltransferase [Kocuria sp.]|uniref:GNAT family N-acetyltransferase n=1 Tax=Kocuria sp. TaxID=1871328 RepID=UPI0026E0BD08|nr:GNAT family N-acetyltransferase [Kocuria sp.]MDO5619656.1 GNAT family N-acetyltransferase [Kocuria sp.]
MASQVRAGLWHVVVDEPTVESSKIVYAAVRLQDVDDDFWPERPPTSVYVHGLMVDRAHAGRGLGTHLLDWASAEGFSRGAEWLRLDCAASNEPLKRYYARQGFEQVGVTKVPGTVDAEVLLWRRPIPR